MLKGFNVEKEQIGVKCLGWEEGTHFRLCSLLTPWDITGTQETSCKEDVGRLAA